MMRIRIRGKLRIRRRCESEMFIPDPQHCFYLFISKIGMVFLRVGQPLTERFSLFKAELEVSLSPPFSVSPTTSPLESSASKRARPADLFLSGGGAKFACGSVKHTGGDSLTNVLMQRTEMLLGHRRAGKRTASPAGSGNPLEVTEWPAVGGNPLEVTEWRAVGGNPLEVTEWRAVGGNPLEKWTASSAVNDLPLARTEGTAVVEQTGSGKCEYIQFR